MDGEWVDDDEEMIDDFVILEPPNFDKYNNTESLQKEKDKKNQGDSMCLIGKPGKHGEVVTL